ncbi:MAG: GNAT family N-acetyltransferase [Alphaproteobacteria bacterium]|nr:GNAT family N-acetyltransferase [Alphaproteobacteria bacterium]
MTRNEVLALEEMNFNAWPALKSVHYDGWLLRSTGGTSRRPNSVNCLQPGTIDLAQKIAAAEALYARWNRRVIFRLTPLADAALDALLEERGYAIEEPTFVQIADVHPYSTAGVRSFESAGDAWIADALRLRGLNGEEAEAFATQHRAISIESVWAVAYINDRPAAVGVAAIERGWVGLHGIHVAKDVRRQGLARKLSEALLGFSYARGARRAWLQVAQANAAALPLYRHLGFQTAYGYHHRIRQALGVTESA